MRTCFIYHFDNTVQFQVIKPFTISVAGSTPLDQGLHIDICLTEILININPNTVELISKCYEALLSKSHVDKENLNEKDLSDLWNAKEFDPDDYWFFKAGKKDYLN